MKVEPVEIYSDASNAAVMRHPGRKFPGVLVQGDTLYSWCVSLDELCRTARAQLGEGEFAELNNLRNSLWGKLNHYKVVLGEHDLSLPFSERP